MAQDAEQRIRDRAYHLWESEGRPHGRDGEFWDRAVHQEHAAAAGAEARKAAPKPVAAAPATKPKKSAPKSGKKAAGRPKTALAPPPASAKAKPGATTRG